MTDLNLSAEQLSLIRCTWCEGSELYIKYHDEEWGVPVHDDTTLFEFLLLESMQSGLSWITVLKKRNNYKIAFSDFNPHKIAMFDLYKIDELMNNNGIIRHRKKIEAAINNAQKFIEIQNEFGSFNKFIWNFTKGAIIKNNYKSLKEVPASSLLSDVVSKDLKKRGFKFVGSLTIYSYLQAIGIVNDHIVDCFRYEK